MYYHGISCDVMMIFLRIQMWARRKCPLKFMKTIRLLRIEMLSHRKNKLWILFINSFNGTWKRRYMLYYPPHNKSSGSAYTGNGISMYANVSVPGLSNLKFENVCSKIGRAKKNVWNEKRNKTKTHNKLQNNLIWMILCYFFLQGIFHRPK